jgi:hypothetical protein
MSAYFNTDNAHRIIDVTRHPRFLDEPTYVGAAEKTVAGPYGAIAQQNNAHAVGRTRIVPRGYQRVTIGIVFEATKHAARGVALDGYDVYQIAEARWIAHRPRR